MNRQLYMGGGITQLPVNQMIVPRGEYGLGSIVKSVTKGITGAVKGAVGAVKDIASSDIGKMALLAAGGYYLGGGNLLGLQRAGMSGFSFGNIPGVLKAKEFLQGVPMGDFGDRTGGILSTLGKGISKVPGGFGTISALGGALLPSLFGSKEQAQQAFARDPSGVRNYLIQYFKNINQKATDEEAAQFADEQTREYAADGGRIGFNEGKSYRFMELIDKEGEDEYYSKKAEELDMKYNPERYSPPPKKPIDFEGRLKRLLDAKGMLAPESFQMLMEELKEEMTKRPNKAYGGPMGEPRENQGGIMEFDYRQKGGFVPVGIKEKADDVPAMLSKNEFVFTADAVRNAGEGNVDKGAQRLYNIMKTLENGGTV
jgi:hypothetical protein